MTKLYCVFIDDIYLKCFSSSAEADILAYGLRAFLISHHMDMDIVKVKEEVVPNA